MELVTCRNCEETGHYSKECPKPRDCKPYVLHSVMILLLTLKFQGPRSNVPTVRSMDIPKSAASSHPKTRRLLRTRTSAIGMSNQAKLMATLAIATTIATPTMRAAMEAMEEIGDSLP